MLGFLTQFKDSLDATSEIVGFNETEIQQQLAVNQTEEQQKLMMQAMQAERQWGLIDSIDYGFASFLESAEAQQLVGTILNDAENATGNGNGTAIAHQLVNARDTADGARIVGSTFDEFFVANATNGS